MAKAKTKAQKQKELIEMLDKQNGKTISGEVKAKLQTADLPEGPRRYMGLPGTTLVGIGTFPQTVEDPEIQKKIERSRSFRQGHVWIDSKTEEEAEAMETVLSTLSFGQLRKLATALGQRNIGRLTKLELLEVCTREGASLL